MAVMVPIGPRILVVRVERGPHVPALHKRDKNASSNDAGSVRQRETERQSGVRRIERRVMDLLSWVLRPHMSPGRGQSSFDV